MVSSLRIALRHQLLTSRTFFASKYRICRAKCYSIRRRRHLPAVRCMSAASSLVATCPPTSLAKLHDRRRRSRPKFCVSELPGFLW